MFEAFAPLAPVGVLGWASIVASPGYGGARRGPPCSCLSLFGGSVIKVCQSVVRRGCPWSSSGCWCQGDTGAVNPRAVGLTH